MKLAQVGRIRLEKFVARTQPDVAAAVRDLASQGAQEFVLDLRDNLGGLVEEGVEVARLFLEGAPLHSHIGACPLHITMLHSSLPASFSSARPGDGIKHFEIRWRRCEFAALCNQLNSHPRSMASRCTSCSQGMANLAASIADVSLWGCKVKPQSSTG